MKRRTFLKKTAGSLGALATPAATPQIVPGGSATATPSAPLPDEFPSDGFEPPQWLHYSQPVYFDGYSPPLYPHMKDFDARQLVQAVRDLGGNLLRFQPIGYRAYYPSETFPVHEELGGRDLVNEVSRECRRSDIHMYCYTCYGQAMMLEPDFLRANPRYADWLMRDPDGKPYGQYSHYGWPTPLRMVCKTGDIYRAALRQVVRELCEHDIDGVYIDSPSEFNYTGICFCDACRVNFRQFTGMDLDRLQNFAAHPGLSPDPATFPADADVEALQAWYAWADQQVKDDLLAFRKVIHGSGKFMLCHNGAAWHGTALPRQYRIPDGFMVESSRDVYARLMTGLKGASMARARRQVAQMYMGSYALTWYQEPPHEQPWVVHNTNLEDGDEILMEGFTNLACGNTPIYATANRVYCQAGGGSPQKAREVFDFMRHIDPIHRGSVPVPYVSIVASWEALQLWRTKQKTWNWPLMSQALGLVMLDERISVDVHASTEISEEWLRHQKVIALCGASAVSDQDAALLADWVDAGGGLLATYDTGLYDDRGRLRPDGGALKKVLGVEMQGAPLASQPECYYRVTDLHAALDNAPPRTFVEGDGRLVPVSAVGDARILADCWNLGTDQVRGPAVIANVFGKGRTIYICGSLEANYLYDRVPSTARWLRSMVNYLGGGAPQPFRLEAPRGVYGVLRRSSNGDLALWVIANVGFKDAASGRMRQEYTPLTDIEVAIRIPEGKQAKSLRLLRAAQDASNFRVDDGFALATIPRLHIAEIVHLALSN